MLKFTDYVVIAVIFGILAACYAVEMWVRSKDKED
jgi:hypothetical protein